MSGGFDAVTATRLWNPAILSLSGTGFAEEMASSNVDDEDTPGFLELLTAMESALPDLNALTEQSTAAMGRVGALASGATSDVQKSDAAKGGFAGRLRIANGFAASLLPIADEFEAIAEKFEARISSIDAGMVCLLDLVEQHPNQVSQMAEFGRTLQAFVDGVRGLRVNQTHFATSFAIPAKFSKPMRVSTRRIVEATGRIVQALGRAEIWNARLQRLVAGRGSEGVAE
jgi:hypothetical protein